jgi:hypothetical protein
MSDYQKVEIVQSAEEPQAEEAVAPQADRPEWLPEKFAAPEDLAKAYGELQTKMSEAPEESGESPDEPAEVESPAETGGKDFTKFSDEFAETGELSSESITEIKSWGIPQAMIDGYMEGQKAVQKATFDTVYGLTGGEEGYKSMLEWAEGSLPEGEQSAFNKIVTTGDTDEMMFAVRSLANRWKAEAGETKPLVQGSTAASGASGGFRSLAELTNAMKDPKYQKDPAYRKDVENRLRVSSII